MKPILENLRLNININDMNEKDIPKIYKSEKINDKLLVASATGNIETLKKVLKYPKYKKMNFNEL